MVAEQKRHAFDTIPNHLHNSSRGSAADQTIIIIVSKHSASNNCMGLICLFQLYENRPHKEQDYDEPTLADKPHVVALFVSIPN